MSLLPIALNTLYWTFFTDTRVLPSSHLSILVFVCLVARLPAAHSPNYTPLHPFTPTAGRLPPADLDTATTAVQ